MSRANSESESFLTLPFSPIANELDGAGVGRRVVKCKKALISESLSLIFHFLPGFHSERMKNRLPHSSQIVFANLNTVVAACYFDWVKTASGYAVHHVALRPNCRH